MASYYVLEGYTTPTGVDSRQKVKDFQKQLGVRVDGIWGPETQAAYSASGMGSERRWGLMEGGAGYGTEAANTFGAFYSDALSLLGTPSISISTPSRATIEKDIAASLRPATDQAIAARREEADANMAELDADAASRGMGASTYVTSMKGRELSESESDVAMLESNYGAALAERVASYMQYYANLELQAAMQNAQLKANAQNAAMGLASQWYNAYLAANSVKGGSRGSSGGSKKNDTGYFSMGADEYEAFVSGLSEQDLHNLFYSDDAYWKDGRNELYDALGKTRYDALQSKLNSRIKSTGISGKGGTWVREKY